LSLLTGFIVTFLGVHILNLSREPELPLDHPSARGHSTLEGGLMNPRLSLQGRMSLDGWNGGGDGNGIDMHMGGGGGRHGRTGSIYRAQTTTLFNAFEGEGGVNMAPIPSNPHRRQPSGDLHQLREADEWEQEYDYDDTDDERTALRKKKPNGLQLQSKLTNGSHSPRNGPGSAGSRSHSHSPVPDSSLTDVRITPRS